MITMTDLIKFSKKAVTNVYGRKMYIWQQRTMTVNEIALPGTISVSSAFIPTTIFSDNLCLIMLCDRGVALNMNPGNPENHDHISWHLLM